VIARRGLQRGGGVPYNKAGRGTGRELGFEEMKPLGKKINPSHGRQELFKLTLDRPHPVNGEWI